MSTEPTLEVSPASPDTGEMVLLTASGTVPEGSTIQVISLDDNEKSKILTSVPFGIGDIPLGTGDSTYTLKILGGTSGTIELDVYAYGDGIAGSEVASTDPIYYYNDAPDYLYPDMDEVAEALEAALPGADVTVTRDGPTLTILFGGKYSGRRVSMAAGTTSIDGSEAVTIAEIEKTGGPFVFGPLALEDAEYVAYLYDDDGEVLNDQAIEFEVG